MVVKDCGACARYVAIAAHFTGIQTDLQIAANSRGH